MFGDAVPMRFYEWAKIYSTELSIGILSTIMLPEPPEARFGTRNRQETAMKSVIWRNSKGHGFADTWNRSHKGNRASGARADVGLTILNYERVSA